VKKRAAQQGGRTAAESAAASSRRETRRISEAAKPATAGGRRAEVEQQRRVLRVARLVSATLGRDFFRSVVAHLGETLGGDCVYIAEVADKPVPKLRSIAVWRDGASADAFEQDLAGAAGRHIVMDGAIAWSRDATRIFPADSVLDALRAESCVGVRLADSTGQVLGVVAVVRREPAEDVAVMKSVLEAFAPRLAAELERKRAEDSLRESEQRYRAFISSSPDGMWRIEFARPIPLGAPEDEQIDRFYRDGYVAECNAAMARFMNFPDADALIGAPFASLFPPSDERVLGEVRSAVRSRYSSHTWATTPLGPDGKYEYRLRSQIGIVEDGELRRIWGVTRDITELKQAQIAVEASERRFREVLENIGLPAVMLDAGGRVTFCNRSLLQIAGVPSEPLVGASWLERIEDATERERWTALLSGGSDSRQAQFHFEGPLHLRGAAPRLIVWDATVLRDESGAGVGLAAIGRDVTEQRALEARLAQSERIESIGRVAAGVAHDFNHLLTIIIGRVSLALEQLEPEAPLFATLMAVQSAANDCASLTKLLLTIGRKPQLRPEIVNLNSVIAAEIDNLEGVVGPHIELVKELEPALGPVWADPVQIRRVLMNLATNARDAMPQGGALTLSTSNVDIGEAEPPGGAPPGRYARLVISDTGVGLTDDVKNHMFDPFFTTKPPGKGSGLGLATVYGIVSQSGGRIFVHSSPGAGTKIEILFPRFDKLRAGSGN